MKKYLCNIESENPELGLSDESDLNGDCVDTNEEDRA